MEDEGLKDALYDCFVTEDGSEVIGYAGDDRKNIVDGLLAIADAIRGLDHTIGCQPTIDMNKDLCKALESMGSSIGGPIIDLANAVEGMKEKEPEIEPDI